MKHIIKSEFIFIFILIALFIGLIAAGNNHLPDYLALARLLLALVFVILLPGYTLQSALFPGSSDLSGPERLALTICLSLGLIPILAMILNYLPGGIDLWPILIAEVICVLLFSSVAIFRRSLDRGNQEGQAGKSPNLVDWWAHQDRKNKLLLSLLATVFLLTTSAMVGLSLLPDPGREFAEFYLLGPERIAEGFPQSATVGQDLNVILGLINREHQAETYRVEIWVQDIVDPTRRQQIASVAPFVLDAGETLEQAVVWQMPWSGDNQQVQFLLFRGAGAETYRSLRLWIDVRAPWQ